MPALPRPALRRPLSLTIVTLAVAVGMITSVVMIPLLFVIDLITRAKARRTRMWGLVMGVLLVEFSAAIGAIVMTVASLGRSGRAADLDRFYRLERWWAGRHAANFTRLAGLRWVVENPTELSHGNAVVVARHASHADALLPLLLFANVGGLRVLYTLKEELQWAPAMDIAGNRLPNVFVDRGPGSTTADQIEKLATLIDDDHVGVIFPEGTFFTPERLDRAATRLSETRPDLEAPARTLEHLLPPRPAGTMALLHGAPDADLILVAHEGMEAFGDLAAISHHLPLAHPVRVHLWRIARSDVPDNEDEFVTWLLDRWIDVDRWIQKRVIERADHRGPAPLLMAGEEIHP